MKKNDDKEIQKLESIRPDEVVSVFGDWYWKQDTEYRFVLICGNQNKAPIADSYLGKTRWQMATLRPSSSMTWDEHRALLDARLPFSDLETKYDADDGETRYLSSSGRPLFNADGEFIGYHGIAKDITSKVVAELALKESEERFRSLIDLSSDWYWELDNEFRFSFITERAFDKAGHLPSAIYGCTRWELKNAKPVIGTWDDHKKTLEAHLTFREFEYSRIAEDGQLRYTSASGMPMFDENGVFKGYRGIGSDITEKKLSEERIAYIATHDGLTGLINRTHFSEILNQTIQISTRYSRKFALVFIDLDRFKFINDSLGHEAGDTLLIEAAKRLKGVVRSSDVVARLGGDEFIVLLHEINVLDDVCHVAEKIVSTMASPFKLSGSDHHISASVGISLYPLHAQDEQSLMKHADVAMYRAKLEGKNNYQIYVDCQISELDLTVKK